MMAIAQDARILVAPPIVSDHMRGDVDAPVTLVEYGEFECPACGRAYHVVKDVLDDLPGQVRFVFRHFARDDVHPFSERAAQAAEAAGAQGRFWEMHDLLFERQHQLEYEELFRHAELLGLDVDRFATELMSGSSQLTKVRSHLESGIASGVSSTPTFFINGARYEGRVDRAGLIAAIRTAPVVL
jgi:protein-disulfide isomerase